VGRARFEVGGWKQREAESSRLKAERKKRVEQRELKA
jgi:hypothetical protein